MLILSLILFLQYPKETNPLNIVFGTGINLYQKVISPSQGDVCNFSPSCSNFARKAIAKYGPFWGLLMAGDRLMRCHPGAFNYYDSYYSGIKDCKVYDPIENNYIFGEISKPDTLKSEW
uniref:Membrane protein insertion efficiency factor YidD n=1 Tax=candidate division WOR-3 bacterium TaxID=2052148 RepID=A0A7C4TCM8_UNCW3